jgi:RNA polymerase sigma-70 factor (ECF subfamily)
MPAATIEALGDGRGQAPGRTAGMRPAAATDAGPRNASARAEADLIDAAKRGEPDAFDEIVRRHMQRAFAVAYRLLGQRQDAEDVVQDAFLAALVKLETFERARPFGPWLLRIVANRGINLRRARSLRRTEPIPDGTMSRGASPLEAAERSELREELQRALARLPEPQRWIVELFELDGFTGPEIAEMLDMAEGTVRWHLHQARQRLRAVLDRCAMRTP